MILEDLFKCSYSCVSSFMPLPFIYLSLKIELEVTCPVLLLNAEGNHSNLRPSFNSAFVDYTVRWRPNDVAEIFTSHFKLLSVIFTYISQHLRVCTLMKVNIKSCRKSIVWEEEKVGAVEKRRELNLYILPNSASH